MINGFAVGEGFEHLNMCNFGNHVKRLNINLKRVFTGV